MTIAFFYAVMALFVLAGVETAGRSLEEINEEATAR